MGDNNIQEFEIGQKVLIVGAGDVQDEFECSIYFLEPEMRNLVGNIATISDKHESGRYNGRFIYYLKEFNYSWVDKWLAPPYKTSDFIYS